MGIGDAVNGRTKFRFSLRTLFVVVTVVCVWIGWNINIVRQRKIAIAEIGELGGGPVYGENLSPQEVASYGLPQISFWRSWLGDKAVVQLILPCEYQEDKEKSERIVALFPERVLFEVWWTEPRPSAIH